MLDRKVDLVIWGKKFCLPFEYTDSVDSTNNTEVELSVKEFSDNSEDITDKSIPTVKEYVNKSAKMIGIAKVDELLECINPHMLLIGIDEGNINIALLCGFKYDPEHDIAIIYREQLLVEVGSQDLVSWC